jgi:beta-1,4-N-acetylglucosaminyltransferase
MKLCLVCSAGGHLTQMMMLTASFEGHEYFLVTSRSTRTEAKAARERVYLIPNVGTNLWLMVLTFLKALRVLLAERPDVIISTGAEVAIPFSWLGKVFGAKVVFIESWSRIQTRSGTGPLVYPVADLFLVQWPTLLEKYGPKARYEGGVV